MGGGNNMWAMGGSWWKDQDPSYMSYIAALGR